MVGSTRRRLDALHRHVCSAAPCLVRQAVIVGSMVLDVHASPATTSQLQPGTTTPGKVRFLKGGVARNIAECMSKLGLSPFLISVVGKDMAGDLLRAHWESLGLVSDGIRQCAGVATPVVSAIFDSSGELAGAVADLNVLEEHLTPEWISGFNGVIKSAAVIMLDANLSEAALEAACKLAKEADVPVWFEPVSVAKSVKYKAISHYITYTSPNVAELVAMSENVSDLLNSSLLVTLKKDMNGDTIRALIQLLLPHILDLLQKGIVHAVLTLGNHGALLCWKAQSEVSCVHFPALPASIASLSGAGDCFVAGALFALCSGRTLLASMAHGIALARQSVQSELNVPEELPTTCVTVDVDTVLESAKQVLLS